MEIIYFDGIPIKVTTTEELIDPLLKRLGLPYGHDLIAQTIDNEVQDAINDLNPLKLYRYFGDAPEYHLYNLRCAYLSSVADDLMRFMDFESTLFMAVAKRTRDYDNILRYYLINDDMTYYMSKSRPGKILLVYLYETRGFDFFVLQDNLKNSYEIAGILDDLGRTEEASNLKKKAKRLEEEGYLESELFSEVQYSVEDNGLSQLRMLGQKFWSDYLSPSVWQLLSKDSKDELSDSFSQEELLKREILSSWSSTVLLLCKCIERELALSIFYPFIDEISSAEFQTPGDLSNTHRKKVDKRHTTYSSFVKAAQSGHSPTLGSMVFGLKFIDDPTMGLCTDMFSDGLTEFMRKRPR